MTSPTGFRTSLQQLQAWRRRAGRGGAQAAFKLPVGATPGDVRTMLAAVAARHEIFRSVLKEVAGVPLQVLDAAAPLHWSAAPSTDHGHGAALSAAWLQGDGEPALWLGVDGAHGDAATLAIVMQELYGQLQGRRTAGDPVQYADYAQWQFELAQSDEHDAAQAFWRAQVLAPTGRLPLEQGSDRNPWQRGEVCVADACEVSEPDVFAAWCLLLARHVGQPAFMLGLVQDGRSDEVADACGPYARVLPLGLRVDLQAPWSDWTHTLAALREDASTHADHLPDLEPAPDLQYGVYPALPQALWCEAVEAPFRLKLEVYRPPAGSGAGLRVQMVYDSSRFNAQAAHELAAQLRWLMAAAPVGTEPLRRISLLSGTTRDFLKGGLAVASDAALAEVPLLHEAIEAQARLTPDAIAVAGDGHMLSYAELDRRAQALALRLAAAGAGPDRIVAVCMERSVDLVVALLGVLKAGAAYLPLDPTYPPQRLAYMVDDSAAGWLVAHEATRSRVPAVQHVLWIESSASAVPAALGRAHPDQLAYVIYTSGSTGRPKGVAITHRNAAHSTLARDRWYERTVRGYLLLSSVAFDSSVAGIFWTLAQGGRLVLPGEHEYRDVPTLARLAALHQVTHLLALPSLHAQLLDQAGQLASLTDVIVAGEACPPALVQAHAQALPQAQLFNEYGPTECTVWSIAHRTRPGEDPVPIGAPVPFIRAFVLDDDLQPLPAGLPGELYLAGPALARGYLGRPDLTAERFVPHPHARGERLYRTGDLVRWRLQGADPRIDFLGRVDQQVKIRGFRIELGEIEARLLEHAAVREAVAIVREDTAGERRIVAYVVPGGPPPQADLLRQHLLRSLPEHLLPTAFVVLQALPLTPNGKVDRNALPAPEAAGAAGYVAPRSATESLLAAIWADVLNVPRVGIHDNFFELGGHSLVATQVMSRVRRSFRAELPVRELFAAPTVSGLAQVVERVRHGGAVEDSPIEPLPRGAGTTLPLSFAQQRLWFLAQLDPQDVSYHIPCLVQLAGRLDVAALQQAFEALQRRHEVLRTAFPADAQGRPVQRVAAEPVARLQVVDLAAHAQPQAEAARLALHEAMQPFSLADGPLLRATLLRLDGDLHHLVLVLHHIVSDGWSTERLLDDLGRLYAQACAGGPVALETLVLQYADYAAWQRCHLTDVVLASELAHWQQVLGEEQPLLALPTDRPRPPQLSGRGARLHVRLPEPLSQAARKFAQRHNASLFMLLETLFAALLARHAAQPDIRIGTLVAARQRIELEPLVGLFVNTVVLRHDFSRAPDLHTLLDATRTAVLDAHQHHELPFERLVDRLAPGRDLSHAPLFQAMFDMQTERYAALASLPGLRGELSAIDVPTAKFDLSLTVAEQGGSIHAGFEYSTDLFDAGTIERLAAHYERLLSAALAAPEVPLLDLPLLTADEAACLCAAPAQAMHQGLLHGAGPAPDFASLWQQSARRFAAALAVQDDRGALNYGELAHRAEALAARLAAAGAGADAPVAILLPRCNDYLVAIVASFLAGAAYLPLDPSLPAARLAHMLALAAPAVLVSDTPLGADLCRAAAVAPRLVNPTAAAGEPPAAPAPRPAHPDQLAYVIFTSGSTGTPKGAMVTQAGMMNNLLGKIGQLGLTPDDRIAQTASPCFDISVWQFLTALLCGASVHILPDRVVRDPAALLAAVNEARISVLESVPSLMRGMLADPDAPRRMPSLRWLLPTGEALPVELARQWLARFPGVPLLNAYGPAECADDVALWRIDTPPAAGLVHLPIGRPAANLRLYVLNDAMQLQPPGVPGELAIGGIGVGRGYLGDAALTAERFVPDPFGPPGSRLYRSGDRVCTDTEGVLTFLGRCDHQVKIRGYRVEPGEVEVRLLQCPGVQSAAVLAHGEPVRLVAYVSGAVTDPQAVRRFVADALPEYMVPAAVVMLPELPLNANGKLDRARLPAPDFSLPAATAARPRNHIEATLAQVWMQVLGLRDVGIHDNFFALGGDSILTIQVVSRAREAGLKLSARLLFLHPTIESLAAVATPAESAVPQGAARGDVPLTPIQRWFFDQPWPNPHHWNQSVLLTPRAALDPARVRATLLALVAHHDALRLRFEPVSGAGSWRQHHADAESADLLEVHDVADADQVLPLCDAVQASLDITRGPLLRGALLRLPDTSQRLLIAVHHLVVDGVSWRILLEDFSTVHGQLARGEAITLPARGASFQDWALELQARAQAGEFDAELDFWRSQDAAPLPVRHPAGARVEGRARLVSARLDRAATGQLLQCARWHARPDDFLLTALAQVLLQWSGQGAVVVEQESHGRPDELRGGADVGRTVGWFTAAYPVRLAPDLRAAPVVQLRQVKQALREVPHQGLGYGVLRHLQRRLDAPAMPVSFNYLGQLDATVEGSLFAHLDTRSGRLYDAAALRAFEFDLNCYVQGGCLQLDWTYGAERYPQAEIEALVQRFIARLVALLEAAAATGTDLLTPQDFPGTGLDADALEQLLGEMD